MERFKKHIFVCTNERPAGHQRGCCHDHGGTEIRLNFAEGLAKRGLKSEVMANKSGCLDACELGPAVAIYPAGLWYIGVSPDDVDEIIETSIVGDGVVERLAAREADWLRLQSLRKK